MEPEGVLVARGVADDADVSHRGLCDQATTGDGDLVARKQSHSNIKCYLFRITVFQFQDTIYIGILY